MRARPVIGLICDHRRVDDQDAHLVLKPYITAAREGAGGVPLLIPVLDPALDHADILGAMDGLLFTGSPSNVEPSLYGGPPAREPTWEDCARDALTMPLLRTAIAAGVPLLCICRGLQELNVALGGSLHQHIHEIPGRIDHREDEDAPLSVQYGPAHDVTVVAGGMLDTLVAQKSFAVNSLHSQGVNRLAPSLRIEAQAPDGQIEAVSLSEPKGFLLALQWHPEWQWRDDPVSVAIWQAFGAALLTGKRA